MADSFGDPTKLTDKNFSRRAKRGVLRQDPPDSYEHGGKTTGYAKGGQVSRGAGAAERGFNYVIK